MFSPILCAARRDAVLLYAIACHALSHKFCPGPGKPGIVSRYPPCFRMAFDVPVFLIVRILGVTSSIEMHHPGKCHILYNVILLISLCSSLSSRDDPCTSREVVACRVVSYVSALRPSQVSETREGVSRVTSSLLASSVYHRMYCSCVILSTIIRIEIHSNA